MLETNLCFPHEVFFPFSQLDMIQSQAAYLRVVFAVHEPCGRWLTPACFPHPKQFLHCCTEMIDLHKTNVSTHGIVMLCEQRICPFSVQGSNERDGSRESMALEEARVIYSMK